MPSEFIAWLIANTAWNAIITDANRRVTDMVLRPSSWTPLVIRCGR